VLQVDHDRRIDEAAPVTSLSHAERCSDRATCRHRPGTSLGRCQAP
jgi:hypothetical protein